MDIYIVHMWYNSTDLQYVEGSLNIRNGVIFAGGIYTYWNSVEDGSKIHDFDLDLFWFSKTHV